jgi:flavin-dependent dehydrogenase
MMVWPDAVDVLILGAGPAGSATALALLAAGVPRVLLVDRGVARPFAIGESATPDVVGHLRALGLEPDMAKMGHLPYHGNCSLWGSGQPVHDYFFQRGHAYGWHLDRAGFDRWLREQAVQRGAKYACPASVERVVPEGAGWRVQVATGAGVHEGTHERRHEIHARVLVDASGRRAALATRLGAQHQKLDNLVALALHATPLPGALDGLSLVEPMPHGWWYATCVPGGRAVVTLMSDHDIARSQGYYDYSTLLQAWQQSTELAARVPPPVASLPADGMPAIHAFAAHSSFCDRAAGRNWLAVGDALLAFDPLTSSGIAGALGDALAAAPVILAQLAGDTAPAREWAARANRSFTRYIQGLRQHYASEQRFADQPFWARRAQTVQDR